MGYDAFPGNGSPKINKDYEIAKLEKKVEELERENEILKNFRAFLSQGHARGAGSSKSIGGEIGPIKKACGLMKVSKSGFHEYLSRKKSNAQIERSSKGSPSRPSIGARAVTAAGASTANCEKAASP